MNSLYYQIIVTLLHSTWQAMLLWGLYKMFVWIRPGETALQKRNLLYRLLMIQLVLSFLTFLSYQVYSSPVYPTVVQWMLPPVEALEYASPYLLLLYCFLLMIHVARVFTGWKNLGSLKSAQTGKPPVELRVFLLQKLADFGIGRNVKLLCSNTVQSPVTFGYLKPVILLPVALVNQLSLKEAESLIVHELTHIRHNDYLLNWFLLVTESLYFFNPFIRRIAGEIRLQRELACDTQVLYFNYPKIVYAEALLKSARLPLVKQPVILGASSNKEQLLQRIQRFTAVSFPGEEIKNRKFTGIAGIILGLILPTFILLQVRSINERQPQLPNRPFIFVNNDVKTRFNMTTAGFAANTRNSQFAKVAVNANQSNANENIQASKPANSIALKPGTKNDLVDESVSTTIEENYAFPVAAIDAPISKDVLVKEENPATGEIITRSFRMTLIDDEWVPTLKWILTERKPNPSDSIVPTNQSQPVIDSNQ